MEHMEKLMHEASQGKKGAFEELYSYAGSGIAEAQYYLALYYRDTNGEGSDYAYWMKKAKENGFVSAQKAVISEPTVVDEQEENSEVKSADFFKFIFMRFSFSGRINRTEYILSIIASILLISLTDNNIVSGIIKFLIDWFWLSQGARRLHDFGASGWWILIPVLSWIYIIFPKGDEGENEYGPRP